MHTETDMITLMEESCTAIALLGLAAEKRRSRIAEMLFLLPEESSPLSEGLYALLAQSQNACEILKQQLNAICHVKEVLETDEDILQSIAADAFPPINV